MRYRLLLFVPAMLAIKAISFEGSVAAPVPSAVSITAGGDHTCAITPAGALRCWGENDDGQLGDGTTQNRMAPVSVRGLSGVTRIAAGLSHTCAITGTGALSCWGDNNNGEVGDGSTTDRPAPIAVPGLGSGVTDVATGYSHTCVVVSGGLKCWGDNLFGQLGDGTTDDRGSPTDVSGLTSGVAAVTAAGYHSCALTTAGGMKCWGDNTYGKVGDGSTADRSVPTDVSGLTSGVSYIGAGEGGHTCAVLDTGALKCWGNNEFGQLGEDRACPTPCTSPVDVTGLSSDVATVTLGYLSTCALMSSGGVKCWGNNQFGQVGDNQACGILCGTPVDVSGLSSGGTAIAMGSRHTCAQTTSALYCWGDNYSGQLGDGGDCGLLCPVPVAVTGLSDFPVGDANCDRTTNSIDSAVVLQAVAGLIGAPPCAAEADVNEDDIITAVDAALILQYEAGLIVSLPP